MVETRAKDRVSKNVPFTPVDLLGEKLVVLGLKLLDNVLVVEQFLDAAVRLAEQVLDGRAAVLPVRLPEIAV